jgi:uncharacterized membrane protein
MIDPVDNPLNYKFGIIYYNPNDDRLIVPKRDRIRGWSFNFAHRASSVTLVLILLIVIISIVYRG